MEPFEHILSISRSTVTIGRSESAMSLKLEGFGGFSVVELSKRKTAVTKKICRSNGSVPTPRRSYRIYLLTLPPSARRDARCPSQARCSFFRGRAHRSLTARTSSPTTPRGPFPPTDPQIAAIDYPRRALFPGEHRRPRFHAAHKADRRDLRLARDAWPCRCSRHSHPPNPGRAKTRPFPQAAMARRTVGRSVPIILPSLLVFSFLRKVDGLPCCDLRWMQGPYPGGRP